MIIIISSSSSIMMIMMIMMIMSMSIVSFVISMNINNHINFRKNITRSIVGGLLELCRRLHDLVLVRLARGGVLQCLQDAADDAVGRVLGHGLPVVRVLEDHGLMLNIVTLSHYIILCNINHAIVDYYHYVYYHYYYYHHHYCVY